MEYPNDFINKVICGDCIEVMPNIPNKSINMVLCDLPYGTYGTAACKWDTVVPFEPLWMQYKRIIKDNGVIVLTASQPFTSMLIMSNLKMFKYEWVWNKRISGNPLLVKYRPLKIHENICIFSKSKHNYFPIMRKGIMRIKGGGKSNLLNMEMSKSINDNYYPTSILDFSNAKRGLHPTQKPVALFEYLIKTYTNKGDLVLDNCAGSGTTGVACKNLGRNYILIEKEKKYCEMACRWINITPEPLFV